MQNTDEHLRSAGFVILDHVEADQVVRECWGSSYHCRFDAQGRPLATAVDYGTAQYSVATLWAIFDHLSQYAYGAGRIVEELAFRTRAIDGGHDVAPWQGHDLHVHSALVPGRLLPILVVAPPAPPKPRYFAQEALANG